MHLGKPCPALAAPCHVEAQAMNMSQDMACQGMRLVHGQDVGGYSVGLNP
jgi:hypothetical protein